MKLNNEATFLFFKRNLIFFEANVLFLEMEKARFFEFVLFYGEERISRRI